MPTTIKLKNGSGAPLAGNLVQGEPALDLTNKRLYTEDSGGTVIEVGTNPTELQVDNINIDGNAITSTDTNGNITITPNGTGEVDISKVDIDSGAIDNTVIGGTTTAAGSFTTLQADTSLNVDGTVTADGLTVDNAVATITNNDIDNGATLRLDNAASSSSWGLGKIIGTLEYYLSADASTTEPVRAKIELEQNNVATTYPSGADLNFYTTSENTLSKNMTIASNGDISFYEDTGATAKFFWDASAESLGIGTTAPVKPLTIATANTATISGMALNHGASNYWGIGSYTDQSFRIAKSHGLEDANTYFTIERSTGNVGIGTSPATNFHVENDASTSEIIRIGSSTVTHDTGIYMRTTGTAGISWGTGGALAFYGSGAGGAERMRIDASGNLDLTNGGGNIIMANGAGIDFSASEGGGATSSVLDDYEEGTFTPEVADAITGGNVGSATTAGYYTKIGRVVHLNFSLININTSGLTSGNVFYIRDLPFTSISNATLTSLPSGSVYANVLNLDASEINIVFDLQDGESYGSLRTMQDEAGASTILVSDIASGSTDLRIGITYTV